MAGGAGEVVFGGESSGIGDGALEDGFGFGGAFEVDEGVAALVEEGGVGGGVGRCGGDEGGEEAVGLGVVAGLDRRGGRGDG